MTINYVKLVEEAHKEVIKKALLQSFSSTSESHFYFTFDNRFTKNSEVPKYLRDKYPNEMTIVLQKQFANLKVNDLGISVTLWFNEKEERLSIPFKSLTIFHDATANFTLTFTPVGDVIKTTEGSNNIVQFKR